MEPLIVDILSLQLGGMSDKEIINYDLEKLETDISHINRFNVLQEKAQSILLRQSRMGIQTIAFYQSQYPTKFRDIDGRPPLIHLLGNAELLEKENTVAVIGARSADKEGYEKAYRISRQFAEQGSVIISGLALGCDTAAHLGCLAANGKTIAIVATGLDRVHPHENEFLQKLILDKKGLILSEQVLGTKATPKRLVARNRLQAALAEKVIVAQCPIRSGTMYTVEFARQYGRDIYAAAPLCCTDKNSGNQYLLEQEIAKSI